MNSATRFLKIMAGGALVCAATQAAALDGVAGAYLAARHAVYTSDFRAAAQYNTQVLARDQSNLQVMENTLIAFVGLGQVDKAVPVARRMRQTGASSQAADIILAADLIQRGEYSQLLEDFDAGFSVGPLADRLLRAWSHFGEGRMSEALEEFDATAAERGMTLFGEYHKALALAAVGDFEGAQALFEGQNGASLRFNRRGVLANVAVLSQLERFDEAIEMIDRTFGTELDPGLADIRAKLVGGEALPFTTIRNAADGAAEVFYTVAEAVNGETSATFTLLYARIATFLYPGHVDATLLTADVLEQQGQFALATEAYLKVPATDPVYYAAELGRADTLKKSGRPDAAIEVLTQLAKAYPALPVVHVTLGDMLAQQKHYEDAANAYTGAIELYSDLTPAQWYVFYARAIANERLQRWELAEPDFRKALELSPEQPRVLNYLGYSLVEKRTNLEEALDMIERAVAARPNDGYITDSLGWVLYRLGRYEEAVPHMERAVELTPIDPIINDHLGDVLWAVGRRLEAEFQWRRALSFVDPEDIPVELDPDRIRRKLEVGLNKVLEEEGGEPIAIANDG